MSKDKKNAIYVGTFDPITNGHFDVIYRASKLFNHLIVAIGKNPKKNSFFNIDERKYLVTETCKEIENVTVNSFDGLAVKHAKENRIDVMVRGLRTEADFVYEMQMAMMNRELEKSIETIFIPTRQDFGHISSTLVKEVAMMGGDVSRLVPPIVFASLSDKYA